MTHILGCNIHIINPIQHTDCQVHADYFWSYNIKTFKFIIYLVVEAISILFAIYPRKLLCKQQKSFYYVSDIMDYLTRTNNMYVEIWVRLDNVM